MEFIKLTKRQKEVLFDCLGLDKDNLTCKYCKKKLTFENCGIFPDIEQKGTIFLCNSPLCISEYLSALECHKDRLCELETLARDNLNGEDVCDQLEDIDPKLRKEYEKLMEWD